MVNMGYCRCRNTLEALEELIEQLAGSGCLSPEEYRAASTIAERIGDLEEALAKAYDCTDDGEGEEDGQ